MTYSVGDVVALKSGGAKMTVESIDGSQIHCVWSDGKQVRRSIFAEALLTQNLTIEDILAQIDSEK